MECWSFGAIGRHCIRSLAAGLSRQGIAQSFDTLWEIDYTNGGCRPIYHMKHLLNHLIQRHVIPLLLLSVVLSGFSCFAIYGFLHELRTSSTTDLIILATISLVGVIGTVCTSVFLRFVRSQPLTWQVFELGRTAWSVLITAAWLAGVACGVLMIFETSR